MRFRIVNTWPAFDFADRDVQLERGDSAAQELVNSLQVLEVMAAAMSAELKDLASIYWHYYLNSILMIEKLFLMSRLCLPVAPAAPSPSVHLPAAPVHSCASHGGALRGRAQ